jgi:hypothetical protein
MQADFNESALKNQHKHNNLLANLTASALLLECLFLLLQSFKQ